MSSPHHCWHNTVLTILGKSRCLTIAALGREGGNTDALASLQHRSLLQPGVDIQQCLQCDPEDAGDAKGEIAGLHCIPGSRRSCASADGGRAEEASAAWLLLLMDSKPGMHHIHTRACPQLHTPP